MSFDQWCNVGKNQEIQE